VLFKTIGYTKNSLEVLIMHKNLLNKILWFGLACLIVVATITTSSMPTSVYDEYFESSPHFIDEEEHSDD